MIRLANLLPLPLMLLCASASSAAERLGGYPVDPAQASVSGISSGAFMANQLQIAPFHRDYGRPLIAGSLHG